MLFGINRSDMEHARDEWKSRRPPEGMSREEWESRRPTPLFTLENLYAGIDKLYDAVTSCRRLGRQVVYRFFHRILYVLFFHRLFNL